ncbi:hypothetical protein ACIQD3_19305 [Peribacillus loiseleuriae]|uniref:hypothetical protein n=1 Tax=Peribacillus loiseleuriae TaxID=1679170 RepID=UPI0037FA900B
MEKYTLILKENDINCSVHFDASEECLVSVDKEGIDVVLDNLVTNAIKYSNGKRIDITSTGVADSVKFTIANGVGGMEKIIWIVCGDLIMY